MKKAWIALFLLLAALPLSMCSSSSAGAAPALPPLPSADGSHPGIQIRYNLPVKMRDGVVLRADVYTPDGPGPYPVLLTRTPYNKGGNENMGVGLRGAQRGFIMANMDVRGRYASAGEWYPFKHEIQDGYDSVEWAAKLPKSNGKVGMWGGSYDGATQWLAALDDPPHLAGIFPMCTPGNYYTDWAYQNGALQQYFAQSWASELAENEIDRQIRALTNPMRFAPVLPLTNYTTLSAPPLEGEAGLKALDPWYLDWLHHPTDDAYWQQWAIDKDYSRVKVPVFNMGGWYDLFLQGTLENYAGIKAHGGTAAARNDDHLLVIPGGHAGWHAHVGIVNFGKKADVDYFGVMMDWYDHVLRRTPRSNAVTAWKRVRYYVMGANVWRESNSWPPPEAHEVAYYLHSAGQANSAAGNGSLTEQAADGNARAASDRFVYDPAHPVPTLGGRMCCDARHLPAGVADQGPDEKRHDVLVYSTPPLAHNLDVTGPVSLTLYVSSSAPDTDFTGVLVDVAPDGSAHNIAEGIVRMRYRGSSQRAAFITPGKIYKVNVDLWATSNVFLAGHRLRLDLSSSNFPRFDRNLNTRESPELGVRSVKATNVIYHNRAHPSTLNLSVMPQ